MYKYEWDTSFAHTDIKQTVAHPLKRCVSQTMNKVDVVYNYATTPWITQEGKA